MYRYDRIKGKILAVLLFFFLITGCFFLSSSKADPDRKDTSEVVEIFKSYSSIEKKYEEYAPRLYHTLLSPTATRVITTVSLAVSFILLIRTRNLRIFLPFFLLALLFAYIVPFLQKFLTAK